MASSIEKRTPTGPLRLKRMLTIVLAFLVVGVFLQVYVIPKYANSLLERAVKEPSLSTAEAAFIDKWRHIDRNPFSDQENMLPQYFAIRVGVDKPKLESITIENTGSHPVHNFWFFREGMPNFYNVNTIVESVTGGKETQREKVLALFSLFPAYYDNFHPVSIGARLRDPSTLLGSVGYGQCNLAVAAFGLLCQTAGCETRGAGLELLENGKTRIAHSVMEVFFDDKWNYFDPDGRVFFAMSDGQLASLKDLQQNAAIIRNGPPPKGYQWEDYASVFERGAITVHAVRRPYRRKVMYFDIQTFAQMYRQALRYDLLPRMRIILYAAANGTFFVPGAGAGFKDPDVFRPTPPYASGAIVWTVEGGDSPLPHGVLVDGTQITVPISSPYITAGCRIRAKLRRKGTPLQWIPFLFSTLYQAEFRPLGTLEHDVPLVIDAYFPKPQPITGYALKFDANDVSSITLTTDIQHNPRTLPTLTPGENRFIFYSPVRRTFRVTNLPLRSVVETDNRIKIEFTYRNTE